MLHVFLPQFGFARSGHPGGSALSEGRPERPATAARDIRPIRRRDPSHGQVVLESQMLVPISIPPMTVPPELFLIVLLPYPVKLLRSSPTPVLNVTMLPITAQSAHFMPAPSLSWDTMLRRAALCPSNPEPPFSMDTQSWMVPPFGDRIPSAAFQRATV